MLKRKIVLGFAAALTASAALATVAQARDLTGRWNQLWRLPNTCRLRQCMPAERGTFG